MVFLKLLKNNDIVIKTFLSLFVFCTLFSLDVNAESLEISTLQDWNSGVTNGVKSVVSGFGVELEAGGSWNALSWRTPDKTLSIGSAFTSDGTYIYVVRGVGDNLFWRYDALKDSWETLADLPYGVYYGSDIQYLNGYIYAFFGGYQKAFGRYSVSDNEWEMLSDYPDFVYQGASMTTDGVNLFAITANNTQNFFKYTISTDTWSLLTSTPATMRSGADLERVGDYIYTPRGVNTDTFYAYSLISNTWSTLANVPGRLNDDMDITSANGNIYVSAQTGTTYFYKYNIATNTWSTLQNAPMASRYGGVQYLSSDGYIYFFRGNGDYRFWKFDPDSETFLGPAEAPIGFNTGSDAVYYEGSLYMTRGANQLNFYEYDTLSNIWSSLNSSPFTFNDDTRGTLANGYIYFFRGSGTTDFARYNISSNTWEELTAAPEITRYGANLVYPCTGDYIYATRGANTSTYWRYSISGGIWETTVSNLPTGVIASYGSTLVTNGTDIYFTSGIGVKMMFKYTILTDTWSELSPIPFSPYYGTDTEYFNGKIYALGGNYETDLWEYDILSDSWRNLGEYGAYGPTNIGSWAGATIVSNGLGDFFISRGGNRVETLLYSLGATDYKSYGTWVSDIKDLTYVDAWSSLTLKSDTPSDSTVFVYTRSSQDMVTWSDWEEVVGGIIVSPKRRYIQVKITLASSSDGSSTPSVSSINIEYNTDLTPPSSPSNIVGYSQEIGGEQLLDGQPYTHTNPSFTWDPATDNETEVVGYYVYFGTQSNANPFESGHFQSNTTFTVYDPISIGINYLRIVAKDTTGNISTPSTFFTYDYSGVGPFQTLEIYGSDFSGSLNDLQIKNNEIILENISGGFWLQNRLTYSPVGLGYGAKNAAYIQSLNKLFISNGMTNPNRFLQYDFESDVWSDLTPPPSSMYFEGGVVEGPDGNLYAMKGNNSTDFWRYDIANDIWYSDISSTPLAIGYGASMVYDGTRYLYVLRGNNSDSFWRYDPYLDVWENLDSVDFGVPQSSISNNVYMGGSMTIDLENQLIYATRGNYSDSFSVYDINRNEWQVLPSLPVLANTGAVLTYYPSKDSLFYAPGNGFQYMFEYIVNSGEWQRRALAPSGFNYGAGLYVVSNYLYMVRGGNSNLFYRYDIEKDSWLVPQRGLFGREYEGSSIFNISYGSDILKGDGDNFYLTRGNYADSFVRWNQVSGEVTYLANTPIGMYAGGNMVYDSSQNKIYLTGGTNDPSFFVYDISQNSWSKESNDSVPLNPGPGSSMVYDGSRYIYLTRAGASNTFYRFDTLGESGSKWSTMTIVPTTLYYGSELLINNGEIYTLRGYNSNPNPFYKYNISGDSWTSLSSLDSNVYIEGFLVDGNDGYLYASKAQNTSDFFRYSISQDSWSQLPNFPGQIYNGASGESNMDNLIYVLAGGGSNTYQDALYTYVQETDSSGFVSEGIYESQIHDLTSVYKWAGLDIQFEKGENSNLIIKSSVSQDALEWSEWSLVSREKVLNDTYRYKINSPVSRYIKFRFELSSGNGINSPVITSYTINYYQDTYNPENPSLSGFNSYSDIDSTHEIVTNTWYSHQTPYFEWDSPSEEYGAKDGVNGSGVSGYIIYWGTNSTAEPNDLGEFQEENSFEPEDLNDGSTYYLRIRTVDDAGNTSEDIWQPFIYKYDISAPEPVSEVAADPAGYTAVNNFSFSWLESSSQGSPITHYCYKTGATSGQYSQDQCIETTSISNIPSYRVGTNLFQVRVKDAAGNYSAYSNENYFYVDSENAPAPPTNLIVSPESSTSNSFGFDWDPPLVGTYYGSESNLSYLYSINALPTEYSVSQTSLTYLNPGAYATLPGENIFYIVTKDEAGNVNYADFSSVSFFANTVAPGIPLNLEIADVSVKSTSSWRLAVSWDLPSEEGSGVAGYEIFRSVDGTNFFKHSYTSGSSLVDSKLLQRTYYYKIKACDNTNNCGAFSEIVSLYPDGRYTEPASLIVPPIMSNITPKKATVSWVTARTADSRVAYGTNTGEYFEEEVSNSDQVADHILTINNLTPGTQYYYIVKWTDEDGNIGFSQEDTFFTSPPPSIQEPVVRRVSLDSALIEFTTKDAVKVRVMYGETSSFGGMVEVYTGTAQSTHSVELRDIKDGTKYFYKINTFDIDGSEYEGETHSFETLPRPKILETKIYQVSGSAYTTLLVEWDSNTPISSVVTYFPNTNPEQALDEVNVALKNGKHRAVLVNLLPNTQYSVIISGRDFMGNEASSGVLSFTTAVDTRPPKVYDLEVTSEIVGSGDTATAQLVVSYKTDEPTTSQVEYGEGTSQNYGQKSQEDTILSNNHIVIISGLTPSKVYHLRAISKDKEGNIGYSIDKVVVTSASSENAFDLAINNLISIFSFLGK